MQCQKKFFRHFGNSLSAMGLNTSSAAMTARCPTPFAFPFTPLGFSLFDLDPSRLLNMLHHQTWLAEETLRNRGLLNQSKDFAHRFTPLSDLLSKDHHFSHFHGNTADINIAAATPSTSMTAFAAKHQQHSQLHRSTLQPQQQQPQQQQQQQQQYKQQPFDLRYTTPLTTFLQQQQQQHHNHQQQQKHKHLRQETTIRSPHTATTTTATTTKSNNMNNDDLSDELKRRSEAKLTKQREEEDTIIELSSNDGGTPRPESVLNARSNASPHLYKDSLEQLLQQQHHRRRSSSTLSAAGSVIGATSSNAATEGLRSYTQLLLSNTPSCTTDTSSCKEKSSSSSTSSTPPPTSALLAQHQHLNQMLKSPSDTSSIFSEPIEEETRCVVCNAHFPNVWLLEQHAALQHPMVGEEKPFICEQCGQSYRYRSAYAKHKEQNHRARLPADKLFTCDVCGMQFRYLKSFKKHRLNHALERLHGKKGVGKHHLVLPPHMDQDVVTSSQDMLAEENGEDLRINIKRERSDDDAERETNLAERENDGEQEFDRDREQQRQREEEQVHTIDSQGVTHYSDTNSIASASTSSAAEAATSSSDIIHSTNSQRSRLLNTPNIETDPSYKQHHQHLAQQHQQQLAHLQRQHPQLPAHFHAMASAAAAAAAAVGSHPTASTSSSLGSLNSISSLINAERLPNEQFLGLNPQEASILNLLRMDERQRDKRPPASRFACPFCGKCVRSKENLKLHVRKHTGERPFVCLFCGRAFGGKSDLTRHLRIHTGERPYHCESCGKCFARADYLSKHLTTHIHNAPR